MANWIMLHSKIAPCPFHILGVFQMDTVCFGRMGQGWLEVVDI